MKHMPVATREPLWREIAYCDPLVLARRLRGRPGLAFLDSSLAHERLGRFSYICVDPVLTIDQDPLGAMEDALAHNALAHLDHLPPFQGGFAGLIAYEFGRALEPRLRSRTPQSTIPAAPLQLYDRVISFDHLQRRAFLVSAGYPETEERSRLSCATAQL